MADPNGRPPPLPARPSATRADFSTTPQPPPVPPRPPGFIIPQPLGYSIPWPPPQAYVPSALPNYGRPPPPPPPALPPRPWAGPIPAPVTPSTSAAQAVPAPWSPGSVPYAANAYISAAFRPPPVSTAPLREVPMATQIEPDIEDVERLFESLGMGEPPVAKSKAPPSPASYAPQPAHDVHPPKPNNRFPTSGVTACIQDPIVFPSTWYIHDETPGFPVCSRCFEDHIRGSPFEADFKSRVLNDGQPRWCRFSKTRVKDQLFKRAVAEDSLALLVGFMKLRSTIPDCKGEAGAAGDEGIRWFRPKNQAIPGMVVCQACYEDEVQARHLADNFEPSAPQPRHVPWGCDMALGYIRHDYAHRADINDYPGFVQEASRRLRMPACERGKLVVLPLRTWYAPVRGPKDALICETCYHDNIARTDEERKWRRVGNMPAGYGNQVYCALGMFNVRIAFGRGKDAQDYSIFWHALNEICRQPMCDPKGMKGATWYALTSRPANFDICGGCYAGIAEPAGIARHFVRRTDVTPATELICDFSPGSPRFPTYMAKLLEAYYVRDVKPLESYVHEFANLAMCRRDEDFENGTWYGWGDCTICPNCHHEFVRGTVLAPHMPLQGVRREQSTMCEMYSPKMRRLYKEVCAQSPPNVAALLAASAQRRAVYIQTMMVCRRMLVQQQIKALQAQTLGIQGSFYTHMGQQQSILMPSPYEYSMAGVGYGFSTQHELTGAIYNKQSAEMSMGATSAAASVGLLEQQWRAVE